jgi:hypothetical protein
MQITFKDKAQADPPSLKSYGGTGKKAESRLRRDEQVHFEEVSNTVIGR